MTILAGTCTQIGLTNIPLTIGFQVFLITPKNLSNTVQQEILTGAKFRENASRLLRKNLCGFNLHRTNTSHSDNTDGHAPHANRRTEEITLNNKAEKQACAKTAQSSFCVEAFAYNLTAAAMKTWSGVHTLNHTSSVISISVYVLAKHHCSPMVSRITSSWCASPSQ